MKVTVEEARSPAELRKIFELRYEVLRAPWGQSLSAASDDLEEQSLNLYVETDGLCVACGRLQQNAPGTGQVRYMAVHPGHRGRGLGAAILHALEVEAAKRGMHEIVLQARENAVDFYRHAGYTVVEKTFLLWGQVQHYLMRKQLPDFRWHGK